MRSVPDFSSFLASIRRPERAPRCAWCDDAAGEHPATADHVAVAMPGALRVDDLLCGGCRAALDEDVATEALADAPEADRDAREAGTLCDECGRHMADARGALCSCCAASWWTPGVYVPRADHEGPRPTVFDCGAAFAGTVAA